MAATYTLELRGLDELKDLLGEFAGACTEEAQRLADETAARAAEEIRDAYPKGPTGNLKKGVRVVRVKETNGHRVLAIVKSTARHAHLYEYGTRRQPARPVMGEIAARVRRDFYADLLRMVERVTGAKITGGTVGQ